MYIVHTPQSPSPFPLPTGLQEYIDPDAICCVVLDEAHHCGKEHPFNRVARSFLTMKAFPTASATSRRASELPKVWDRMRCTVDVCGTGAIDGRRGGNFLWYGTHTDGFTYGWW